MIYFPNGFIQVVQKTGGGFSNGKPVAVTETQGDPIVCHYETVRRDKRGQADDSYFTQSSYKVRIDIQEFSAETIELFRQDGTSLGKFTVQNAERLELVGQVLITV